MCCSTYTVYSWLYRLALFGYMNNSLCVNVCICVAVAPSQPSAIRTRAKASTSIRLPAFLSSYSRGAGGPRWLQPRLKRSSKPQSTDPLPVRIPLGFRRGLFRHRTVRTGPVCGMWHVNGAFVQSRVCASGLHSVGVVPPYSVLTRLEKGRTEVRWHTNPSQLSNVF